MADDKGGGGSAWGPFEIILVILFAIALISKLQGEDFKPLAVDDTDETIASKSCSLSIARPQPLETVGDQVSIVGSTIDCDQDTTLSAQIVDAKNIPLSRSTIIAFDNGSDEFSTTIALNADPSTNTGYVLLYNAPGQKQATARIPIQFER